MSRMIRHKEEKRPRESKPKQNIPKPPKVVPRKETEAEIEVEDKSKANFFNHVGIFIIIAFAIITIVGVYNTPSESSYLTNARPIYDLGYNNANDDIWHNETSNEIYLEQLEFIKENGGGNGTGTHYIPSINSEDGINKTEEKLIYAAGYTNGFADSMIHGYNTQRNNIPE